jgi:hypothetical protein
MSWRGAEDPKRLGVKIGFTSVLHTWGGTPQMLEGRRGRTGCTGTAEASALRAVVLCDLSAR